MLEVKTFLGDWKSVTRKEAESFYALFIKHATAIKTSEQNAYFNTHHIRGGHAMLTGEVETNEEKEVRLFQSYKKDLVKLASKHGRLRFNCIEHTCSFPNINPYEMGASLVKDGIEIVYDDSSISKLDNATKKNRVEKICKKLAL